MNPIMRIVKTSPSLLAKIGALVLAITAISATVYAQDSNPAGDNVSKSSNTITVSGVGLASNAPDLAYIELGVQNMSNSLSSAYSESAAQIAAIMQTLGELGVKPQDMTTVGLNIYPQDVYNPQTGENTGERTYQVHNMIRVVVRDITQIETVIAASVDAGANSFNSLSFGIADTAALESDARAKAVANAKDRAEQLAAALGVSVGNPISIIETYGQQGQPPIMFARDVAFEQSAGMPVSGGLLDVTIQVEVTFELSQ